MGTKGKGKVSRNTTPTSSVVSVPVSVVSATGYLDIAVGHLVIPANLLYDDILERHGGTGGIPDPKHLEALENDLNTLAQLAETRETVCDGGMRELSSRRKEKVNEELELEQATRDAEEKASLKRAADEELERGNKANKTKKRKERSTVREERPLAHGAHGVSRQDGLPSTPKGINHPTPSSRCPRFILED
jgi:transcriptional adapter 3